jgi:hypothetical protein
VGERGDVKAKRRHVVKREGLVRRDPKGEGERVVGGEVDRVDGGEGEGGPEVEDPLLAGGRVREEKGGGGEESKCTPKKKRRAKRRCHSSRMTRDAQKKII